MAKINLSQSIHNNLGSTPYGNLTALHFVLETNSTGAALNSNSTAAIAIGDVVVLGTLPAGTGAPDRLDAVRALNALGGLRPRIWSNDGTGLRALRDAYVLEFLDLPSDAP